MRANAVNLATFINALCHLNATPLSVAVLAPCAWGENLACGVAWQISMAQQSKRSKFSVASVCEQNNARQIQHGENVAVLTSETDKAKMGQGLGGGLLSLSLSLAHAF